MLFTRFLFVKFLETRKQVTQSHKIKSDTGLV